MNSSVCLYLVYPAVHESLGQLATSWNGKKALFNENELYSYYNTSRRNLTQNCSSIPSSQGKPLVEFFLQSWPGSILTSSSHVDSQWLLRAPRKDNESSEGDVPRLPRHPLHQDSEPNEKWNLKHAKLLSLCSILIGVSEGTRKW